MSTTDTIDAPPPGVPIREAHAHVPILGRSLRMVDLSVCGSRAACLDALRAGASALDGVDPGKTRWLLAGGMRVEAWSDRRWPTRDELDALLGGRAGFAMSFDYHSLVASTPALRAAGIAEDAPSPAGGVLVRDGAGRLTGVLLENACRLVRDAVPPMTGPEQREALEAALAELARCGFSSVHDLLAPAWLGPRLAEMHDAGALRMPVGMYVPLEELDQALGTRGAWERPGAVELLGAKVFADGTLNARTAWMLHPFAQTDLADHPCGKPLLTVGDLARAVQVTHEHGLGLAVHAIGDGAVHATLNAVEHAGLTRSRAHECVRGRPHVRIEHCELIDERDVGRFGQLRVVASVQPCHLLYDVEALTRACPDRLHRVLPLRELLESGLTPGRTLLFGSDVPIVRAEPRDSIVAAVHRRRTGDVPGGAACQAIAPEQAIDARRAWACFRTG